MYVANNIGQLYTDILYKLFKKIIVISLLFTERLFVKMN